MDSAKQAREQAVEWLAGLLQSYDLDPGRALDAAEYLYDEGWRPAPSGDAVERARALVREFRECSASYRSCPPCDEREQELLGMLHAAGGE